MGERKYALRYTLEPGEFTREADVRGPNDGLSDAFLAVSILFEEGGGVSYMTFHGDGRTGGPLASRHQLQAWTLFAGDLAEDECLSSEEREIARQAFEAVRALVRKRRGLPNG